MKSSKPGAVISEIEVTNISRHGFWIMLDGRELFLPFTAFPWFKKAKLDDLFNVEILNKNHLFWPSLDVDLNLDMIEYPEKYPLVSR